MRAAKFNSRSATSFRDNRPPVQLAGLTTFLCWFVISTVPLSWCAADAKSRGIPVEHWVESSSGCTFSTTEDGKYIHEISSADVTVSVSVDARELQLLRHRIEPILGLLLTVQYRGTGSVDLSTDKILLEFVKHFRVVQNGLDPDSFTQKIQSDADALNDENRRVVEKHPEQKEAREARFQQYQKSVAELIEFLSRNSLRPARLDRAHPGAAGWIFFNTSNKWLGTWKNQEEFVLRFPLDGKVFEFPFKLPPKRGELILRKRD